MSSVTTKGRLMEKIAIPVFAGRISNRLDCSESILLVTIKNSEIVKRSTFHLNHSIPSARLKSLLELGIDVLICNGIPDFYLFGLRDRNILVIPWISGDVENILTEYLDGTLSTKILPGSIN